MSVSFERTLVQACEAEPDQLEPRRVYADWLAEQDRADEAELVRLHLIDARDHTPEQALRARALEDDLEERLCRRLAGSIPGDRSAEVRWRRGVPRTIVLHAATGRMDWGDLLRRIGDGGPACGGLQLQDLGGELPALAHALREPRPWVRRLDIWHDWAPGRLDDSDLAAIDVAHLRAVRVVSALYSQSYELPRTFAHFCDAPRIEAIELPHPVSRQEIACLPISRLRRVELACRDLSGNALAALDEAGDLEELVLTSVQPELRIPLPPVMRKLVLRGDRRGLPPLGRMLQHPELRELGLGGNPERLALPCLPPRLERLSISHPAQLPSLPRSLRSLAVHLATAEADRGSLPGWLDTPGLEEVILSSWLGGPPIDAPLTLDALCNRPPLRSIVLRGIRVDRSAFERLCEAHPHLEQLSIDYSTLGVGDMDPLYRLTNLRQLHLHDLGGPIEGLMKLGRALPYQPLMQMGWTLD